MYASVCVCGAANDLNKNKSNYGLIFFPDKTDHQTYLITIFVVKLEYWVETQNFPNEFQI